MKLQVIIKNLQELEAKHGGELEVFSVSGSSGASEELSNAFFDDDATEQCIAGGPLCEYKKGQPYIWIYSGN
jgi:hypothetical protein